MSKICTEPITSDRSVSDLMSWCGDISTKHMNINHTKSAFELKGGGSPARGEKCPS